MHLGTLSPNFTDTQPPLANVSIYASNFLYRCCLFLFSTLPHAACDTPVLFHFHLPSVIQSMSSAWCVIFSSFRFRYLVTQTYRVRDQAGGSSVFLGPAIDSLPNNIDTSARTAGWLADWLAGDRLRCRSMRWSCPPALPSTSSIIGDVHGVPTAIELTRSHGPSNRTESSIGLNSPLNANLNSGSNRNWLLDFTLCILFFC